ncbi:MAG: hypothetical protein ACOCYP_08785 [Planctomycetota bacterium]
MSCPLDLVIAPDAAGEVRLVATAGTVADGRSSWKLELVAGASGFRGRAALILPLAPGPQPWFLFPGFFYGSGRSDPALHYPALAAEDDDGDDPWASKSWDFALDRGAFPVLLAWCEQRWCGVEVEPHYRLQRADDAPAGPAQWGESEPQVGLGLSWEGAALGGALRINLPANEAPRRHARCPRDAATERYLGLAAGDRIALRCAVWDRDGAAHGYQPILERVYNDLRDQHPPALAATHAELADCAADGLLDWHWVADPGYMVYTAAFDRSVEFNANNKGTSLGWHFEALGFVGGFPVVFGLLWHHARRGHSAARAAAERMIGRFCAEGQSEWGFFRASYHPGRARTRNGSFPNPAPTGAVNNDPSGETPFYGSCWQGDQCLAHARTTADASLYLARCLALLGAQHPRYGAWRSALRRSLEAALSVQDAAGRFGQLYDLCRHTVAQEQGAGGLLWIVAMDRAIPLFADDPAFVATLETAMARAGVGYAPDVEAEYICGAPEDVRLAPTSEDGYNAIMAYAALHRRSGTERDRELLQRAADWTLTWRKAYNVRFASRSALAQADFRTVGGDFASAHNNHLHVYGCNCLADLHYLAGLSGNEYYSRRADDHFAFTAQLLCLDPGQWNGQRGMMTEQFYTSDWSVWGGWDPGPAHRQKGTWMGFSHVWCINMILLGLEQLEQAGRLEL